MLELILLASVSGIIGLLIRAALENETSKFCLYHSIAIGTAAGIFAYFNPDIIPLITTGQHIGFSIFFAMFGYAASDVLDSIVYIIRNPYNPMKMFAAVWMSLKKEMEK
jgi:hypothetical protein